MRRAQAACIVGLLVTACEQPPPPSLPGAPAPSKPQVLLEERLAHAKQELGREFVVFAEQRIVIDRLDSPRAPPVTVGSRPGPETMSSDDPSIVTVEPNGALVAHRDGSAQVRAPGSGSALMVIVRTRGDIAASRRAASTRPTGVSHDDR